MNYRYGYGYWKRFSTAVKGKPNFGPRTEAYGANVQGYRGYLAMRNLALPHFREEVPWTHEHLRRRTTSYDWPLLIYEQDAHYIIIINNFWLRD